MDKTGGRTKDQGTRGGNSGCIAKYRRWRHYETQGRILEFQIKVSESKILWDMVMGELQLCILPSCMMAQTLNGLWWWCHIVKKKQTVAATTGFRVQTLFLIFLCSSYSYTNLAKLDFFKLDTFRNSDKSWLVQTFILLIHEIGNRRRTVFKTTKTTACPASVLPQSDS